MKPEIWGPHAWIFLHSITLEYPDKPTDQEMKDMYIFLTALGNVLPCKKCKYNFESHLKKYPINNYTLKNKKNLTKWLIDIHNCVNKMNDKQTLNYDEAIKSILMNYDQKINYYFILLSLFLFLSTLMICIYKFTF